MPGVGGAYMYQTLPIKTEGPVVPHDVKIEEENERILCSNYPILPPPPHSPLPPVSECLPISPDLTPRKLLTDSAFF